MPTLVYRPTLSQVLEPHVFCKGFGPREWSTVELRENAQGGYWYFPSGPKKSSGTAGDIVSSLSPDARELHRLNCIGDFQTSIPVASASSKYGTIQT